MLRNFRTGNPNRDSTLQVAASAAAVEASKVAPEVAWAMAAEAVEAAATVAIWEAATTDSSTSPTLVWLFSAEKTGSAANLF